MSSGIVLLIVVAVILIIVAYLVGILIRNEMIRGLHSLKNASKNCLTCQFTKKLKKLKIFI